MFVRATVVSILSAAAHVTPATAADIPSEYKVEVTRSSIMGTLLELHQLAGSIARDELEKRGILKTDSRINGWISAPKNHPAGILVTFTGEEAGLPLALYRVVVDEKGPSDIEVLTPAQPLSESDRVRVAARDLATAEFAKRGTKCAERHDAIVTFFESARDPFLFVYLLPTRDDRRVAHVGGEVRYEISADGTRIDDQRVFGESCLTLDIPAKRKREKADVIRMKERTDPAPTEWQVFVSRISHRTLEVETPESGLVWKVQKGNIELVGPARN